MNRKCINQPIFYHIVRESNAIPDETQTEKKGKRDRVRETKLVRLWDVSNRSLTLRGRDANATRTATPARERAREAPPETSTSSKLTGQPFESDERAPLKSHCKNSPGSGRAARAKENHEISSINNYIHR